jgi:hypothetical protein
MDNNLGHSFFDVFQRLSLPEKRATATKSRPAEPPYWLCPLSQPEEETQCQLAAAAATMNDNRPLSQPEEETQCQLAAADEEELSGDGSPDVIVVIDVHLDVVDVPMLAIDDYAPPLDDNDGDKDGDSLLRLAGESPPDMETQNELVAAEARKRNLASWSRYALVELEEARLEAPTCSTLEFEAAIRSAATEADLFNLPLTFLCDTDNDNTVVLFKALEAARASASGTFYIGACWGPAARYSGYLGGRGWVKGHFKRWNLMHVVGVRFGKEAAVLETECITQGMEMMGCQNNAKVSSGLGSRCINFLYVCTDEYVDR